MQAMGEKEYEEILLKSIRRIKSKTEWYQFYAKAIFNLNLRQNKKSFIEKGVSVLLP